MSARAALIAVTDELEAFADAAGTDKEADKASSPSRKIDPRKRERLRLKPSGKGKVSIRQRVADIKARAAHTPQHTKNKQYQPKHSINNLTK